MRLTETIAGTTFTFRDCKDVLNKASEEKSGDRTAEVAAQSVRERIAAKRLLAEFTLRELYEHPSVPYELDEITRLVIDDLDARAYARIQGWTVAQLREWILARTTSADARTIRAVRGIYATDSATIRLPTFGPMAAARPMARMIADGMSFQKHLTNVAGMMAAPVPSEAERPAKS